MNDNLDTASVLAQRDQAMSRVQTLELEAAHLRLSLAGRVCEICFTASFTPTPGGERCECCRLHDGLLEMKGKCDQARQRIAELEAALKPFAEAATTKDGIHDRYGFGVPEDHHPAVVTYGDCRKARAVLEGSGGVVERGRAVLEG